VEVPLPERFFKKMKIVADFFVATYVMKAELLPVSLSINIGGGVTKN